MNSFRKQIMPLCALLLGVFLLGYAFPTLATTLHLTGVKWHVLSAVAVGGTSSASSSGCSNCLYVATTGNDSTGNGSLAAPFATIEKALTVISPPTTNTIVVENGTYTLPNSGSATQGDINITTSNITLEAQNRGQVTLYPPSTSTSGAAIYVQRGADNVTIDGFIVDGCPSGTCSNGHSGAGSSYWEFGNTHVSTTVDGFASSIAAAGCSAGMLVGDVNGDIPSGTTISSIAGNGLSLTLNQAATAAHTTNTIYCWGEANDGQWRNGIYSNAQYTTIQHNEVRNIAVANPMASYASAGQGGSGIQIDGYNSSGPVPCANVATSTLPCGLVIGNKVHDVGVAFPGTYTVHCFYISNYGAAYENNIVYDCPEGWGFESWHGASHNVIANNLIFQSRDGIEIGSGQTTGYYTGGNNYTLVFNNILYDPYDAGSFAKGILEDSDGGSGGSIGGHNQYIDNLVV
jgi:hypothetical protein